LGTSLSPYLYFWHASQEAEEVHQQHPGYRVCRFRPLGRGALGQIDLDTKLGMISSNLISFFIVALMAQTIWRAGAGDLTTLRQAAEALEPLAGQYAAVLFTLGIIGAGVLAIPVLAGSAAYALSEAMGWQASLDKPFSRARAFYLVMITAVVMSLVIPFTGITVVQALFWTAVINGLIAPVLLGLVVHMANNPNIVGTRTSSLPVHALGVGAMFLMLTGTLFVIFS
jgi:Mn2+/Fe2+ NRAMP family transporter